MRRQNCIWNICMSECQASCNFVLSCHSWKYIADNSYVPLCCPIDHWRSAISISERFTPAHSQHTTLNNTQHSFSALRMIQKKTNGMRYCCWQGNILAKQKQQQKHHHPVPSNANSQIPINQKVFLFNSIAEKLWLHKVVCRTCLLALAVS